MVNFTKVGGTTAPSGTAVSWLARDPLATCFIQVMVGFYLHVPACASIFTSGTAGLFS